MDWKHTFLFLVVAIPSVAILTRVIAWLTDRRKRKLRVMDARQVLEAEGWMKKVDGIDWIVPPVGKPYATHEEYMNDLRGTVDLEEFLARCRAGVPEDPRKASTEKTNLAIASARERLARIKERLERTLVSSFPNASVPVANGGAGVGGGASGGVGGDGSDGGLVTGLGSPPPAQDQPKLQIHRENSCPACRGDEKTSGHTYSCYMCNRVVVPNTPR
jgi:hypothetical protein